MAQISRRKWFRSSLLAGGGMLLGAPAMAKVRADEEWLAWSDLLKLNWNENPYGPPQGAMAALTQALPQANRYPDQRVDELKAKLGARHGLTASEILITAGSTEILSLLGQHVGLAEGQIITPWPSFPTMIYFGQACGAQVKKVPLRNNRLDLPRVLEQITDQTTLAFICNPNNPTSTEVARADLLSFCRDVPSHVLVCVDEAYIEFSSQGSQGSVATLVGSMPNLIVCRTFSKAYGLAGLRIGYAISQRKNIEAIRRRHLGWELSTGLAPLVAAEAALVDDDFVNMVVARNEEGRQILYDAFKRWEVAHAASSTNFVYARSDRFVSSLVDQLKTHKVLITKWPDMHDHIRISIGTPQQMHRFVDLAEQYLIG